MEYDYDNWDGIQVPLMEYTYRKPIYEPASLMHVDILSMFSAARLSAEEIKSLLNLPHDELCSDLHSLIYRQLNVSSNPYVIRNSLLCLRQLGNPSDSLPVILDILRQNETFFRYHFDGYAAEYIQPLLYQMCKDHPRRLLSYLLESGLYTWFKTLALESLAVIANLYPPSRDEMLSLTAELLAAYKADLPQRTICDGEVVGFALLIPIALWAEDYLPLIEELCASGLVDYGIVGKPYFIRRDIKRHKRFYNLSDFE